MKPLGKTRFAIHSDHVISSPLGAAQHVLFSNLACWFSCHGNTAEPHSEKAIVSLARLFCQGNVTLHLIPTCHDVNQPPNTEKTRRKDFQVLLS